MLTEILQADGTGWRENGRNGYIWSFSPPGEAGVRYYEYDPSRSHKVVERILEGKFKGHLVSDFYGGYNDYGGKKHGRLAQLLVNHARARPERAPAVAAGRPTREKNTARGAGGEGVGPSVGGRLFSCCGGGSRRRVAKGGCFLPP